MSQYTSNSTQAATKQNGYRASSNESQTISILVINPNSTESMTAALKPLLADLLHPRLSLDFYTAPASAPPSINDAETSSLSAATTFPTLLPFLTTQNHDQHAQDPERHGYSAYLVACYSPHPLTTLIRTHSTAPVLNIFEASILHARALGRPFGIVTTGKYWETVLTDGVRQYLTGTDTPADDDVEKGGAGIGGFIGVRSTGLNATELHSTEKEEVDRRIAQASAELVREGADIIILGCAGMSGMEEAIRRGADAEGRSINIVDGVRAGVILLEGLVRAHRL